MPLELKVNGARALRLEPHATSPNVIGGFSGNTVTSGVHGATISGGGETDPNGTNRVTDEFGTVGGGRNNRVGNADGNLSNARDATVAGGDWNIASGMVATVGGGESNTASGQTTTVAGGLSNTASGLSSAIGGGNGNVTVGQYATVGGGASNEANNFYATVGGGFNGTAGGDRSTVGGGSNNSAGGQGATVGGGESNTAGGTYASVPGGNNNAAAGAYSFAAGRQAKTGLNDGVFIWGDSTNANITATGANQFIVRASGGIWLGTSSTPAVDPATDLINTSTGAHLTIGGAWTNSSDLALKRDFQAVNAREALERLLSLPVQSWGYNAEDPSVRHVGPTGQDFYAAFGLGADDKSIATVDADGVAFAAIQGLHQVVQEKEALISTLAAQVETLQQRLEALEEGAGSRPVVSNKSSTSWFPGGLTLGLAWLAAAAAVGAGIVLVVRR